ncbi:uncharacterized protein LOC117116232 [Anneissia japonica]|uniref:uncharacterized protein LOC117116232 n=1 Tax=Anneissia japonica TaxID=1529436 RepID=UPI0014255E1E|nr:uncharacterized protein LOC117116232 [Anneissia japonica]
MFCFGDNMAGVSNVTAIHPITRAYSRISESRAIWFWFARKHKCLDIIIRALPRHMVDRLHNLQAEKMSEVSESASEAEGRFQDLPDFSSELQNPDLKIGSGTSMELSAYTTTTTEKISGTLSYTTEPENSSHGIDYGEWSKEFKQLNHLLTVGKCLPAQSITTIPSHLGQPCTTTQSNDPSNEGQSTVCTFNQLESFNSYSTTSSNKLPDSLDVRSLQNKLDKNDTVAAKCRNSMEPLPDRALNPASCSFWKVPSSTYSNLSVSSCRTVLADRFNQSTKFIETCDVSDNYPMIYSPQANESLRNDQTSSYAGSNLHIQENVGYGLSGDNNLEINSIGQVSAVFT